MMGGGSLAGARPILLPHAHSSALAARHPRRPAGPPTQCVHGMAPKPPSPHRVPESALSVSLSLREEGEAGGGRPS